MDRNEILLELSHKLEDHYGVQPGIFHELGSVLVEDASQPDNPINPQDIEAIIQEVANQFHLRTGDLAYSVNGGNILVGFSR